MTKETETRLYPYFASEIEVVEVAIEYGFSNSIEDPIENPDQEW